MKVADSLVRKLLYCGISAAPLFFFCVVIFAALQTDYSHSQKMVSQLGATSADYFILMNLFGFVGTGMLIVVRGFGAFFAARQLRINALFGLFTAAFGLMFIGITVPMDVSYPIHVFFANGALIPLFFTLMALALTMWRWNIPGWQKLLFYAAFVSMYLVQTGFINTTAAVLQRLKLTLIFIMYSNLFFSLQQWLNRENTPK